MNRRQFLGAAGAALLSLPGLARAAGSPIVLGQSAATTGPAQELGKEMNLGASVWFDHINSQGGVNGRKIELRLLDDAYDPAKTEANTRRFISEGVFALFGYVGTPTSLAAKPIFSEAGVPFIAPFTGADALRSPVHPLIFNVRASYFDETEKLVEFFTSLGQRRIAVFYQNDAYGAAGLEGVVRALKRRDLAPVAKATVERNSTDVAAAVKTLLPAAPDVIIQISAYTSCAAFVKAARQAGSLAQFANVSFVGTRALSNALGPQYQNGIIVSQVVPWKGSVPVVREYQRLLKAARPNDEPSFIGIEGFIGAKVVTEALNRAGNDPTPARFVSALESMRMDMGGFPVHFSRTDHEASNYVELVMIGKDGVVRV